MEVAPGIYRIETSFGERTNAVYYLWGTERGLLVDTGTRHSAPSILSAIAELGAPLPDYVLNTHCDWDHTAGNGVIRSAAPGATLLVHLSDRAMIEDVGLLIDRRYGEFAADHGFDETDESKAAIREGTTTTHVDLAVAGGEELRLGSDWTVTILHTPGHSDGSISVADPRSRALIVGDAVLGNAVPLANGAPAFPPTYRYVDDYLATVRALETFRPDLVLTSHYPIYAGTAAADFLAETRDFVEMVDSKLSNMMAERDGRGLLEIADSLSGSLGNWPQEAAPALLYPLAGHVERLLVAGRVAEDRGTPGPVRYRWTA